MRQIQGKRLLVRVIGGVEKSRFHCNNKYLFVDWEIFIYSNAGYVSFFSAGDHIEIFNSDKLFILSWKGN